MPRHAIDIIRTAHLWIQQHGDDATARARRTGHTDGADSWLRISVAIGTLGIPTTKARH
jgi:hypothetical protein